MLKTLARKGILGLRTLEKHKIFHSQQPNEKYTIWWTLKIDFNG